jgi:hypothetical protein
MPPSLCTTEPWTCVAADFAVKVETLSIKKREKKFMALREPSPKEMDERRGNERTAALKSHYDEDSV